MMDVIKQTKRWIKGWVTSVQVWSQMGETNEKAWRSDADYQSYLTLQLKRTIPKKGNLTEARTHLLVGRMQKLLTLEDKMILSVGARNGSELDLFEANGAKSAVGIDLFSADQRIYVMDMHQMEFENDSFDIVYSSHSLEHAFDSDVVIREFVRVCRPGGHIVVEVPVKYKTRGADLIDFADANDLLARFEPNVGTVVLSETLPPDQDEKRSTSIARIIFQVKK